MLPFSNSRLGIMATLIAILPAGTDVWVETTAPNNIHVYVGDGPSGAASEQLLSDVRAMGDTLRPVTTRYAVQPFANKPKGLDLPQLSTLELACALYVSQNLIGTRFGLRLALPDLLGLEFHQPWGKVLAHVADNAGDHVLSKIQRVLPELIGPGLEVEVVRSGIAIPGLVRERRIA